MASKPISKRRAIARAALALTAVVMAATTARADSIFDIFMPDASPFVVRDNIARMGFVAHSALSRRGDVYLCDVVDRYGASQRLVIDAHSGRIIERYAARGYEVEEPRRPDPRPRVETRDWGLFIRPEVDVPVARRNQPEAFPVEAPPDARRVPHHGQLAYGEGQTETPIPDPRPVDKPKPKLLHPKHQPAPSASDLPETATVTPATSEPAVQPLAPATSQVAPTPPTQQPAAAEPAKPAASGVVVSTATAEAPASKAPPPLPAKAKAINDIPVAPLD